MASFQVKPEKMRMSSRSLQVFAVLGAAFVAIPNQVRAKDTVHDVVAEWVLNDRHIVTWRKNATEIVYVRPKLGKAGSIKAGTLLVRLPRTPVGRQVSATAFSHTDGCAPAPYPVKSVVHHGGDILHLQGSPPIRQGCQVVGFAGSSQGSVLRFEYTFLNSPKKNRLGTFE